MCEGVLSGGRATICVCCVIFALCFMQSLLHIRGACGKLCDNVTRGRECVSNNLFASVIGLTCSAILGCAFIVVPLCVCVCVSVCVCVCLTCFGVYFDNLLI